MSEDLIKNLKCPNCAAKHYFKVEVTGTAEIAATKIGEVKDVKWSPTSTIYCKSCYASGTVEEFTVRRASRSKAAQKEMR
jgi:predicted nucleic-acid-binding Zn-ribbon protein